MHRNLGLVAAAATLLAAAPLSAIFQSWTWLLESIMAVALVAAAAMLARLVRAPVWGQGVAMASGLLLALIWMFPSHHELLWLVPTPDTFAHFGELLTGSVRDMQTYGVEVPDTQPLLFITVLGIGAVAVVVDLVSVGLRRPALAGLPMLAIYSVPVAVYVDSVPPIPFAVGAMGFMWLLMADSVERVRRFGRRFTGEGRDVDVWEPSPLAAAGRRLAVVGVALAVLAPIAVPGMSAGLLNRFNLVGSGNGTGGMGPGGAPGRVDLFAALSGQLNQSEITDLVKVTTAEPEPFYLRFGVADELRPDGFRVRNPNGQPANRNLPDPAEGMPAGVTQRRYNATVEVSKTLNMPLLPVYAEPVKVHGLDGNWLYDPDREIIFAKRGDSRGKRYSFDYVRSTYTPEVLRSLPMLAADDSFRLQQTDTPEVPEVDQLVARLIKGKRTQYDMVRAVYDYFSADNGFAYRLSTEGGTSGKDIVDFLTNKVGYCQQYAAAMAWLVRAAGIPARVAFGFTNGSNRRENTYTLTNRNLHAWTEVYFARVGWVPFDATPASGVPGSTRSAWAPDTDAPDPATNPSTPDTPGGVGPSGAPDRPDGADRDPDIGLDSAAGPGGTQSPAWPWWTAGILLVLGLLALPGLRRLALRRRREVGRAHPVAATVDAAAPAAVGAMTVVGADDKRARAEAHAAWDELLDTLVDFRIAVDRTETPRATAERLVRHGLGDQGGPDAARLLGRAEERARYAREPLPGGDLHRALRAVRRALAAEADRRTRIMATVLPPSVLLRWRATLADTGSRLVALSGRVRSTLLRWDPRRRMLARRAGN